MERYEAVRVLGRGSFATVILAKLAEKEGGLLRVIKEVDLTRADEKRRNEALYEVELLKSFSHPNIIAYHEAHLANARLCIVMEFADAGDLAAAVVARRAANRRYHEREAMAIFVQLAMALQYIHEKLILHRDLKSQNVFLTQAGVVKLGDFGIAKVLEAADSMAETRIGTPYYLSPEMCENKPYDFRADIWGLGVVLYEVLALEIPFSAPDIPSLVMKICSAEPRPVSQAYSSDLRTLLKNMLAKRSDDRPSCAEIVALPHVRRGIAMLLKPEMPRSRCSSGLSVPTDTIPDHCGSVATTILSVESTSDPMIKPTSYIDLDVASLSLPEEVGEQPQIQVNNSVGSLKHAFESSMACEQLLRELEQEFNLA